jgi:hypothetical protein
MPTRSNSRAKAWPSITQRQLGRYRPWNDIDLFAGIDPSDIIGAVRSRRQHTISATAGLTL